MIRVFMVVAHNEAMACRVFIGCEDTAVEFAAWAQMNGWRVRIDADVDPRTQPRIKEEEDVAGALVSAFEQWKVAAQPAT